MIQSSYDRSIVTGVSDNRTEQEPDGTLVFQNGATVWDDIQFPVTSGKVPAANFPDWVAFTANTSAYEFDVNDYIDTQTPEINHWWKEGTTGKPHLHVTLDGANATGSNRFVKYTVWIAYADVDEVWAETSFTAELTIPTGTADRTHMKLPLGSLALPNNRIGTHMNARIKRIAATGGTDTQITLSLLNSASI